MSLLVNENVARLEEEEGKHMGMRHARKEWAVCTSPCGPSPSPEAHSACMGPGVWSAQRSSCK